MLPKEFPKWKLVYYYFRKWVANGLLEEIHDFICEKVRLMKGKKANSSLGLIDSQSVKTNSITEQKGHDGNKKIQGQKRHIVKDTLGLIFYQKDGLLNVRLVGSLFIEDYVEIMRL